MEPIAKPATEKLRWMNSATYSATRLELIRSTENLSSEEFSKNLERLYSEDVAQAEAYLWARCATDLELYADTYFAHYCRLPFNEFHRDRFKGYKFGRRGHKSARAAPRGYAKSTVDALIKPIHDVCYGTEDFIAIFSNTQTQSDQKLKDIRNEILTNELLIDSYRVHFLNKRVGETDFVVYCEGHKCKFQSFGSNTEVRGVRFNEFRPSKIVVDDGEHSEEVENEAIRAKYSDWWKDVVLKLGDPETNIEVIGTVLHPESLLIEILNNPGFESRLFKAVISWSEREDLWEQWRKIYTNLEDAERLERSDAFYYAHEKDMLKGVRVLWPEKESYLYLMRELVETGKRSFWKEKQNEPIGGQQVLFEKIHYYQETAKGFLIESTNTLIPWERLKDRNGRWLHSYGALDPATGQTKAAVGRLGDYSSLVTGMAMPVPGREFKMRLFVHAESTNRDGPSKFIRNVFEHHEAYDYQKFAVETNLYRDLLLPNFEAERKIQQEKLKKEIRVPFYDVVAVDNKEKRIHTLEPKVTWGWILFNRALSKTAMRQIETFPTPRGHDDFPDALEILWGLVNNRYRPAAFSVGQGGR